MQTSCSLSAVLLASGNSTVEGRLEAANCAACVLCGGVLALLVHSLRSDTSPDIFVSVQVTVFDDSSLFSSSTAAGNTAAQHVKKI